jgi:hypothetical protein
MSRRTVFRLEQKEKDKLQSSTRAILRLVRRYVSRHRLLSSTFLSQNRDEEQVQRSSSACDVTAEDGKIVFLFSVGASCSFLSSTMSIVSFLQRYTAAVKIIDFYSLTYQYADECGLSDAMI